jgi:ABC-type multidrug transport system ATPase subunit
VTSAGPCLRVLDLGFRYPGVRTQALRQISFDVERGEVLGVLGPNGSGKTTLLAALLGVRHGERTGQALIDGRPPARDSSVGYAAQDVALYRQLTVRENLGHVARLRLARRAAEPAVQEAIEDYGLAPVATTQVHRLSGGWRRLAHVAASFVHRPDVRLLDEPTAALDFEARGRLLRRIQDWRRQGVTTLLTSHYPEDIDELCTSVVLLDQGRMLRKLRLDELLGRNKPTLRVESTVDGEQAFRSAPAPVRVGELVGTVRTLVADLDQDAALADVRIVHNTLRDYLTAERLDTGLPDVPA